MKLFRYILAAVLLISATSCKSSQSYVDTPDKWVNIAVAEDVEIFVDTTSIKRDNAVVYAYEKRIYISPMSKKLYVDKIRNAYFKMGKAKKADKWNDFSYCIYYSLYDCTNKRFRVLSVEDYDSAGKRISKTQPNKNNIKWLDIEAETVGDYTFFFVCDYDN